MNDRDKDRDKDKRKAFKRPRKPKVDPFKTGELEITDYRDVKMLRRFISDTGKILPRRRTGLTPRNQRRVALMIKRARSIGLVPYMEKLIRR